MASAGPKETSLRFSKDAAFLALACAICIAAPARARASGNNSNCSRHVPSLPGEPHRHYCVDVARITSTGEKVRGPVTLVLQNVNVLRYDVQAGQNVTYSPGPDLSKLGFIPSVPVAQPAKGPVGRGLLKLTLSQRSAEFQPPDWTKKIQNVFSLLQKDQSLLQADLHDATRTASEDVNATNAATTAVDTLVRGSDTVLQTEDGTVQIVTEIGKLLTPSEGNNIAVIPAALATSWPDDTIAELEKNAASLEDWVNQLPQKKQGKWSAWSKKNDNATSYDNLKSTVADIKSKAAEIDSNSQKAKGYKAAISSLKGWNGILSAIQTGRDKSFTWRIPENCSFAFSGNKETVVVLNKTDRLAPKSKSSQGVVTVVCSSPVTIGAGFGFARLAETNYAFVQSAGPPDASGNPTVVSKIGLTSQSNFRTVPVILVNTRLKEFNEIWAFHFSTGAAVSLSSGAVGNNVEYVVGGSLSFRRAAMVTVGVEVGRESSLAGGFKVGEIVPTNLDAPPIQQKWAVGPAFMFTYIIR